jgi:hypothetical protein
MKTALILSFSIFCISSIFSQIESGKKGQEIKEVKIKREKNDSIIKNSAILSYGFGNSFRTISIQDSIFTNPSELREEFKVNRNQFAFNLKKEINKNFAFSMGVGYQSYGEQFNLVADTAKKYEIKYKNFVIPLQFYVQTGGNLKLFASTGFQAQFLFDYEKETTIRIADKETISSLNKDVNLRKVNLASTSSLGLQYYLSNFTLTLKGDFIYQLSSTYQEQKGLNHHPFYYGISFGFGFYI